MQNLCHVNPTDSDVKVLELTKPFGMCLVVTAKFVGVDCILCKEIERAPERAPVFVFVLILFVFVFV